MLHLYFVGCKNAGKSNKKNKSSKKAKAELAAVKKKGKDCITPPLILRQSKSKVLIQKKFDFIAKVSVCELLMYWMYKRMRIIWKLQAVYKLSVDKL